MSHHDLVFLRGDDVVKAAVNERFPPYYGPEWEKKIGDPCHPNFWKYGVANLIFLNLVGNRKLILDVGCGTGGSTRFLARKCRPDLIVGVDIVRTMIQVAKEKTKEEELEHNIDFAVCDGEQLPFRDSSFEAIVSRGDAFVWLIPQDQALLEFKRVMEPKAVVVLEMDNGAFVQANTTFSYFEKMRDGRIAYVTDSVDDNRNQHSAYYFLRVKSDLANKISQTQEFIKTGHYSGKEYSPEEIEKEVTEIRRGLATHWYTASEIRDLFRTCGFEEIEVLGNGLLMKLFQEGNEKIINLMKTEPEMFFKIKRRLIPFADPEKTPTIIVKGSKGT